MIALPSALLAPLLSPPPNNTCHLLTYYIIYLTFYDWFDCLSYPSGMYAHKGKEFGLVCSNASHIGAHQKNIFFNIYS